MKKVASCVLWASITGVPLMAGQAHAAQFQMQFTMTDFSSSVGLPAPQGAVSGQLVYEAESAAGFPLQLLDVSLNIAGHAYSMDEVSVEPSFPGQGWIGGARGGATGMTSFTDDFVMLLAYPSTQPASTPILYFSYTTARSNAFWDSFTVGDYQVTAVPEVPTLGMFALGGLLLGVLRRRARAARYRPAA